MKPPFQLALSLILFAAAPAIVVSRAAPSIHYIGSGHVMSPVFMHAEVLDVYGIDYEFLQPGRTVAFQIARDGITEIIAHRLIRQDERGDWITRADQNAQDDPWRLTRENYVGVVEKANCVVDHRFERTHVVTWRHKRIYVLTPYAGGDDLFSSAPPMSSLPWEHGGANNPPPISHSVPEHCGTLGVLAVTLCLLFVGFSVYHSGQ